MARSARFWLFKSEPESFSIQDLASEPGRRAPWDGVRNYQARNLLRDEIAVGDGVLFYHSNARPPGLAGRAVVVRAGYPDDTAFDPEHAGYDPRSTPEEPRWFMVDIELVEIFPRFVPLSELRACPELEGMELLRKGSRLSVQPVRPEHWARALKLGDSQEPR